MLLADIIEHGNIMILCSLIDIMAPSLLESLGKVGEAGGWFGGSGGVAVFIWSRFTSL